MLILYVPEFLYMSVRKAAWPRHKNNKGLWNLQTLTEKPALEECHSEPELLQDTRKDWWISAVKLLLETEQSWDID